MTSKSSKTLKGLIQNRQRVFFLIGISITVFILYLPALNGQFLLDDFSSIVKNQVIRSFDLKRIFLFSPFRFMGYLSLSINFYFSKLDPYSYYMVNIGIHILFVIMYFLLLQILWQTPSGKAADFSDTEKEGLAMVAAVFIAVHPMSSFAVSYIIQRLASLAGLFFISCLFFYLKMRLIDTLSGKISYLLLFVLFLLGALFTKQNAFTVFPVIILIEMFLFDLTKKKIAIFFSALAGIVIFFIFLALFNVIDLNELQRLTYETKIMGRMEYLTNQFPVLCFYLTQIFFPDKLAIDYNPVVYSSYFNPHIVISGIILLSIISFSIFIAVKGKHKLAGFGILFYFITISIESSIIPIRDLIFIHRTYLPNAGMFFAVVLLTYVLLKRFRAPLYVSGGIFCLSVVLCIGSTWKTNKMFQNPLNVWQRVIEISPDHARGYAHLGMTLIPLGRYDEAEDYLLKAINLDSREISILNNLGVIYSKMKQYDKAIELYNKIIGFRKNYVQAYVNLGNTYSDMGQYDQAIETYRQGYKYNKNNFTTLLNLGKHLAFSSPNQKNKLKEALKFLDQAQKINDQHPLIYYSKGIAFLNLKDYSEAKKNFKHALFLNPDFINARKRLEELK